MMPILTWLNNHSPLLYLTQSFWRDEAFAWAIAKESPLKIIHLSVADFNPPLHYLLLNGWMKVFGESEISLRMLSFLFFILLLLVIYFFSSSLVSRKFARIFVMIAFLNPMLLTYAFEVRMYSLYAFLATLSTYALYNKRWYLYVVSSILGLYTHSYMPFTLLVHVVYIFLIRFKKRKKNYPATRSLSPFFYSFITIVLFYLPWLPILFNQWQRSQESWIYPIDIQLITSSLGNLFVGYDGTPVGWWWATRIVSIAIVAACLYALKRRPWQAIIFNLWIFLPLFIILTVSLIKPIYVNRYLIFVTVGETFIVSLALISIPQRWLRKALLIILLILLISIDIYHPYHKRKLDTRSVYQKLNNSVEDEALILTDMLVYFDGLYYFKDPSRVFVYRPVGVHIPTYVGSAVIFPDKYIGELPTGVPVYFVNRYGDVRSLSEKG